MKILLVNKFLYPNGGSETYLFELGKALVALGHEVEYFGMEHPKRCVGNRVGAYTSEMDFHGTSKLRYAVQTIYSKEARKKIRAVLHDFQPDVVHLNNFNYQLTPSVILEIEAWRTRQKRQCKIVYTAHDYQLVCPNHMLFCPTEDHICERCLSGKYRSCVKGKCIHGSRLKSVIGALEGWYWKRRKVYRLLDAVVCPSRFLREKLEYNPFLKGKTIVLRNFIDAAPRREMPLGEYVLYFGRLSREKGIETLLSACRALPDIPFVFAGGGPLEAKLSELPNARFVGFQTGDALDALIRGARFSVYPSEWYENCPLSVMESLNCGTPVIGARIGGIPELIAEGETGDLFASGSAAELKAKIEALWNDRARCSAYVRACGERSFDSAEAYCDALLRLYR